MEKRIKYSQFQQVKYAAKMIDPLHRKITPLKKKIEALVAECKGYQAQIDALEAGIVSTLGFHVSDLVKKVIEPTGNMDKNGNPVKTTKFVGTSMVRYDDHSKEYVVTVPEEEKPVEEQQSVAEETAMPVEDTDEMPDTLDNVEFVSNDEMFND